MKEFHGLRFKQSIAAFSIYIISHVSHPGDNAAFLGAYGKAILIHFSLLPTPRPKDLLETESEKEPLVLVISSRADENPELESLQVD